MSNIEASEIVDPIEGPVTNEPVAPGAVEVPRLARHEITLADGHLVGVTVAGEGVPLVVVHGFSAEGFLYAQSLSRLVGMGFRVVAIDTAGHGATQGLPLSGQSMNDYADLLGRCIDELGIERFVLAGHSMGGQLVARLAAQWPERTMAVILIEPIAGLSATTTTLLVIPALAAALLGGLESFAITTAAGLGIGMVQSLILGWSVRPDTHWIPDWIPTTGIQQVVPVLVIIGVLIWRGDALPDRSAVAGWRLPPSPQPRHVTAWTVALVGLASAGLLTFGSGYRHALIVSMVFALLTLSVVVLTGFSGQISLAQLAFAGVAGFASIRQQIAADAAMLRDAAAARSGSAEAKTATT